MKSFLFLFLICCLHFIICTKQVECDIHGNCEPLKTHTPIDGLEPKIVWKYFLEISKIPRCSFHEQQILEYLIEFAKSRNWDYKQDEIGNLLIRVPHSTNCKECETASAIILQAHVDMVCEKNQNKVHDFSKDPIQLVRDGDYIRADGTTLGADDGIGIALALAAAVSDDFKHGPMELLFTVSEEVGLLGVQNMKPGFVNGTMLINLDGSEPGKFLVGCAGGATVKAELDVETVKPSLERTYVLKVTGLKGGHSGMDIHLGRANAIQILAQLLSKLPISYELVDISGGEKENAIPREAQATLQLNMRDLGKLRQYAQEFMEKTTEQYKGKDDDIEIAFDKAPKSAEKVFSTDLRDKVIKSLLSIPHGVIEMSKLRNNEVETSNNLASIHQKDEKIQIIARTRSMNDVTQTAETIKSSLENIGAKATISNVYPSWNANTNSSLLQLALTVYKELYGKEAELETVHGGVEPSVLGDLYNLDMISFGARIENCHSPNERLWIPSMEKSFRLLKSILTAIVKQNS